MLVVSGRPATVSPPRWPLPQNSATIAYHHHERTTMSLFRADVQRMGGYTPGEQPQDTGWVKLNTNENPYPPSPLVVERLIAAASGKLNLYPDPLAKEFRNSAGAALGVDPEWILPGNGSDENLTILMRSFVDAGEQVAYPYPSYTLYETLADIQGAKLERIPLAADWSWNFAVAGPVIEASKLVFVPNPNSPSGNRWDQEAILRCVPPKGILVLDEAYGDFCDTPHQGELLNGEQGRQIVITRTLSKSYSLAGIRFGFAIAHPDIIAGMRKVKDGYNCDRLSLVAATAALEDQTYMQENAARIRQTRQRLFEGLQGCGFQAVPSQANFVWCTYPGREHAEIYQALKDRKILIRYMKFPGAFSESHPDAVFDGLRITVGTDAEIDHFLTTLKEIL